MRWKGFTVESDTWKGRKNLKNAKEAIKEFEKEYQWDIEDVVKQEHEKKTFGREELPERFTARKLSRWLDKRYDQEYWKRLERNWRQWKGKQSEERKMETITEEEENKKESSGVREWTENDDDKIGNIVDLYYEL